MSSEGVMLTNDDASMCKRYAISKGYWNDDYMQNFIRALPSRKAPEINRGYYLRHYGMKTLIEKFLVQTNCNCQIVSLGAGYDTTFWNLQKMNMAPKHGYYEIDMKPVVQRKMRFIQSSPPLNECLRDVRMENVYTLNSKGYHLLAVDITNIAELARALEDCGVKPDIPTLFVVECVFVYIKHDSVENLLNYISHNYATCMVIDYDPVSLEDRFGEVMKQNLRSRDCHLVGAHPTLQSKVSSYKQFSNVSAKLLSDIYREMPLKEKTRMEKIEFLDEVHLLLDLLSHYCICVAVNDKETIGIESLSI